MIEPSTSVVHIQFIFKSFSNCFQFVLKMKKLSLTLVIFATLLLAWVSFFIRDILIDSLIHSSRVFLGRDCLFSFHTHETGKAASRDLNAFVNITQLQFDDERNMNSSLMVSALCSNIPTPLTDLYLLRNSFRRIFDGSFERALCAGAE